MAARPRWLDRRQSRILAARYLDVLLADRVFCAVLLGEAVFVAAAVAVVWHNQRSDPKLHFFLVLACIWFGCFHACREIVRERAIYLRERMVNLTLGAYVLSKLAVLVCVAAVQCLVVVLIVRHAVALRVHPAAMFVVLLCAQSAGTALGLAVSALTTSENTAVAVAVMAMVPQILFSQFFLRELLTGVSEAVETLMLSKWAFDALGELSADPVRLWPCIGDLAMLSAFTVGFALLAVVFLRSREL